MRNTVVAARNGIPVFLRDVADVHEGFQPRLGIVGEDKEDDIVEAIVLLQRGEKSLPALAALRDKAAQLNFGILPHGIRVTPIYDRTDLIGLTTKTVRHVIFMGLGLVTALLLVFLGNVRMSLITALAIPCSILFAFALMVWTGQSANLISIGAIDFGILVDAAVIVLENVFRRLNNREAEKSLFEVIAQGTAEASRPVLFSVLVVIVALIPLFTMRGVPGKIFAPMSVTYVFALTGALLFSLLFAPVVASLGKPPAAGKIGETRFVAWLGSVYSRSLSWALGHRGKLLLAAGGLLAGTVLLLPLLGGEFMPKLEEGNLWVRATLPQDVSFEAASRTAHDIREMLRGFPEVTHVVSQVGRPDDGTDITTFNNIEFFVQLTPQEDWKGLTKPGLIQQMNTSLDKFPGMAFNFSQNIQDNVEEAMSGVKGENSLKLFGDDIDVLMSKANEIRNIMAGVPGVTDLAVFQETGQPQLLVTINREASARYGLMVSDVNASVQAAIGGIAVTQVLEGDRRFDFVVRYRPEFRQTPEAIRNILLPAPDGGRVPLGQVARVEMSEGAFMIYRENGLRYVPIKFSVRGRDLESTVGDVQERLKEKVRLPEGYQYEWAGEYDALKKEQRRLAVVVPISLLIILALLFMAFHSFGDAFRVLLVLPFGAMGGLWALLITGTPFSISASVGFASVIGVATLGGVVFLSGIRRSMKPKGEADRIEAGAREGMRPVVMACLAAGLGLLPAAVSSGIGAQAQQPLARVVVGGMVTSTLTILFLIPVLATYGLRRRLDSSA
jgi:heavy metal efflux system protein